MNSWIHVDAPKTEPNRGLVSANCKTKPKTEVFKSVPCQIETAKTASAHPKCLANNIASLWQRLLVGIFSKFAESTVW